METEEKNFLSQGDLIVTINNNDLSQEEVEEDECKKPKEEIELNIDDMWHERSMPKENVEDDIIGYTASKDVEENIQCNEWTAPKEETEDDAVLNAWCTSKQEITGFTKIMPNIGHSPIVYTTKLDDMCILKQDVDHLSIKDVTDRITTESKPRLRKLYKYLSYQNPSSFYKVVQKLDEINSKTCKNVSKVCSTSLKTGTTRDPDGLLQDKNRHLLNLCKPFSIVLEDLQLAFSPKRIEKNKKNCYRKQEDRKKLTSRSIQISDNIEYFSKNKFEFQNEFLLWYETYSKELDIYYIDSGSVTEHYRLKNDAALFPYIANKPARKVVFCCWYNREHVIKSMFSGLMTFSTPRFLRKPHICPVGECICCCKKSTSVALKKTFPCTSMDVDETLDLEQVISTAVIRMPGSLDVKEDDDCRAPREQLLKKSNSGNLIDNALRYNRPTDFNKIPTSPTVMGSVDHLCLVELGSTNNTDYYEIGLNGNILAWTKRTGRNIFDNIKLANVLSFMAVCCWAKRDKIISAIFDAYNHNLTVAKNFMRYPHSCLVGYCTCCCRNLEKSMPTNKIMQNVFISVQEIIKSVNQDANKNNIDVNATKANLNKKNATQEIIDVTKKYINVNPLINVPKLIPDTTKSNVNVNASKNMNDMNKNVAAQGNVDVKSITDMPQEMGVSSLISTILDRFKDVRLTINEDGKVAAQLKTPVNTLSRAELKVLSNILAHAQEQVNALGLRSGDNMNLNAETPTTSNIVPVQTVNTNQSIVNSITSNTNSSLSASDSTNFNSSQVKPTILNFQLNNPNERRKREITNFEAVSELLPVVSTKVPSNTYKSYSILIGRKSESYNKSLISYANAYAAKESGQHFNPIIENVYSLQETENNSVMYKKSDVLNSEAVDTLNNKTSIKIEHSLKRKSDDKTSTHSKVRVVCPSKLGGSNCSTVTQPVVSESVSPVPSDMLPPSLAVITVNNGIIQLVPHSTQVTAGIAIPHTTQSHLKNNQMLQQATNSGNISMLHVQTALDHSQNPQPTHVIASNYVSGQQTTSINTEDQRPGFIITKPNDTAPTTPAPVGFISLPVPNAGNINIIPQPTPILCPGDTLQHLQLKSVTLNLTSQQVIDNTINQTPLLQTGISTKLVNLEKELAPPPLYIPIRPALQLDQINAITNTKNKTAPINSSGVSLANIMLENIVFDQTVIDFEDDEDDEALEKQKDQTADEDLCVLGL